MLELLNIDLEIQPKLAGVLWRLHGYSEPIKVDEAAHEKTIRFETDEHVINGEQVVPFSH